MGKKPRTLDSLTWEELDNRPQEKPVEPTKDCHPEIKKEGPQTEEKGKRRIKTPAKAYGLKSLMALDGKILLTTFGPKENPIIFEQRIDESSGGVTYVLPQSEQTFDTALCDYHQLQLKPLKRSLPKAEDGKENQLLVNSPVFDEGKLGMDYLGFKPKLELEMFGTEKPNDNIHVQIAYNVLDLKKIIGFQIGDVVQSLMNIGTRRQDITEDDLVGLVHFDKPCPENRRAENELFFKHLQPYAIYYDGVLEYPRKMASGENKQAYLAKLSAENDRCFRRNYNLLRILSVLRQACVHTARYPSLLFSLESNPSCADIAAFAKDIFEKDFVKFVKSFSSNSQKNLAILYEIENINDEQKRKAFSKEYLNYLLFREGKNMGFSLRNIRMLAVDHFLVSRHVGEQEKYALLAKLNAIFDFLIYRIYQNHPERISPIVASLRAAMTEEDKETIYKTEFESLLSDSFIKGGAYFTQIGDVVAKRLTEKIVGSRDFYEAAPPQLSVFTYFLYVACKFMDGKEVNELTTSIINKFENIGTLVSVLKDKNVDSWHGFTEEYVLFRKYSFEKLADQLRLVKNMGSVKRKLKKQNEETISSALYADAINMFQDGNFVEPGDANMKRYMSSFFSARKYWVKLKNGKSIKMTEATAGSKVRNFLTNAIINNRRFAYLIKYIDPRCCRKLITNHDLVRFILQREDMPLSQLQRYYTAVTEGMTSSNRAIMVDRLVRELSQISIQKNREYGQRSSDYGKPKRPLAGSSENFIKPISDGNLPHRQRHGSR